MPKLTVAIPTYNRCNLLKKAIESVLCQTYRDFILLVLDNCSTDGTHEAVKSFSDERIKYIRNESNIGWLHNANKSFTLCETEYLIIFHDDDVMKSEMLEKEIHALEANEDIAIAATNINFKIDGEISSSPAIPLKNSILFSKCQYIYEFYKNNIGLPCPSVMFRMNFIRKYDLQFREHVDHCADAFFWCEVNLYDKKILLIDEPLMIYTLTTDPELQNHLSIGKHYKYQFILHENVYKLLNSEIKCTELVKLVIRKKNYYLNLLMNDFLYNRILNEELDEEMNKYLIMNIGLSSMLKLKFKSKNHVLLKILFRLILSFKNLALKFKLNIFSRI